MAETLIQTSKERYAEAAAKVCEQFGIKNRLAGPRIVKVSLNMGVGRAIADGQILNIVAEHLSQLAGQRAQITKARKAIAQFRSRAGVKIGARATLRGERMWAFVDKFVHLAVPRIKDFRGLSPKGFDKQGNYSVGLTEQALFPEIQLDKLEHNQGLNVTVVYRKFDSRNFPGPAQRVGFPIPRALGVTRHGKTKQSRPSGTTQTTR